MATKKPVKKGAKHSPRNKVSRPTNAQKATIRDQLVSRGVPLAQAEMLSGELENISAGEIAERRIKWQKDLPKGS